MRERAMRLRLEQAMKALLLTETVKEVWDVLARRNIDPVMLKGLSSARHYRTAGDRPFGDVDLLISSEALRPAISMLEEVGFRVTGVDHSQSVTAVGMSRANEYLDLQTGLRRFTVEESREALNTQAILHLDDGREVRILPPYLEVRFLAVHALWHGISRPIWLCDLASILNAKIIMDWNAVLADPLEVRSRVLSGIGLAHRLLGAPVPESLVAQAANVTSWLEPIVLHAWQTGEDHIFSVRKGRVLAQAVQSRDAQLFRHVVSNSWPTALEAMNELNWPIDPKKTWASILTCAAHRSWRLCSQLRHHLA
ncbi:MAG: nucleotidyltransferase family protein [Chloroflexota bacterium]|nr:nucleotidyltransferase family protein [Chloroflexota bacterium]